LTFFPAVVRFYNEETVRLRVYPPGKGGGFAELNVRRNLKKFRACVFALCILLSFSLTYLQYDSLSEIHFLAHNPTLESFENTDQEDLATDTPYQPERIVLASHANPSHPGIQPFKDSFLLHFQPFPPEDKISVLRC
jgi:hypothetical protein